MVKHVMSGRERKVLKRGDKRWLLEVIGWVGLNPFTRLPAGYSLVVRS